MSQEAPPRDAHAADLEHVPPVEVLLTDVIARLALAAHVYLAEEEGKTTDLSSAEAAIDVAGPLHSNNAFVLLTCLLYTSDAADE